MMFFSNLAASVALLSLAVTSVHSVQIPVTVGGPGGVVAYSPNNVTANPGDVVVFTFLQKNHTATQSSFGTPCVPLPGGFDSGFVPIAETATTGQIATFTVKDTNPVWVYCRQTGHCEQGMVFAINPGSATKFEQFVANAEGSSANTTGTATSPAITGTGVATVTAGQAITTTYGSYPGSSAPTSSVSTDHQVVVGGPDKLLYSPSNISAQIGDTVTFTFMQKNHTVTQSNFAVPCRSLTLTSTSGQIGFDSGFMPVAANATTFPTYTIQINNTTPIWAYCRQSGHCGQGMVFSVNAIADGPNNFAAFQAAAIAQNGTANATTSSTGSASSPSTTSGASQVRSAGVLLAFICALVGVLL